MESEKLLNAIRLNCLPNDTVNNYCDIIKKDLNKAKKFTDVEEGKILLYHGELIMMNKKTYHDYINRIGINNFYEPHTLVLLKNENFELKSILEECLEKLESKQDYFIIDTINLIKKTLEEYNE